MPIYLFRSKCLFLFLLLYDATIYGFGSASILDLHITHVSRILNEKFDLELWGREFGGDDVNTNKITQHYYLDRAVNIDFAREIYITTTSLLLDSINNDKTLRPKLHNYPFENKNLNILFSFNSNSINDLDVVYEVHCIKNLIYYKTLSFIIEDEVGKYSLMTSLVESYEDAKKIINGHK